AGTGSARAPRVRRIVVSSGTLVARIAGVGELSADGVELVPDTGGVRMITGPLRLRVGTGPLHAELELARSAAEVTLPHVKFGRVLAVGGHGHVAAGDRALDLRDIAIGRLAAGGALELRAALDDGPVSRPIAVELAPDLSLAVHGDRVPLRAFAGLAPHGLVLDDARATGSVAIPHAGAGVQGSVDGPPDGPRPAHHARAPPTI